MADTATLQARLSAAETALHDLMIGNKAVSLATGGADGKSITYTPAEAGRLRAYIAELNAALGGAPRRVLGVQF